MGDSYYFKVLIEGKVVYIAERMDRPFQKGDITFETGKNRLKGRICGNYNCKNHGKSWDTEHHSTCPHCPESKEAGKKMKKEKNLEKP